MADLQTVDIPGVEILREGRWNGRHYTVEEFDQMVEAFHELKGIYDPPCKLGHNKEQSLLTKDGLPAAGWISNLERIGDRLIADFSKVPAKVASLIKSGGYRKRSSEVWFGVNLNGKKYPAVLKAVAWLGADPPAVSSLNDVVAMYSDEEDREVTVATMTVKAEELAANACPDCDMDCTECKPGCPCHKPSSEMSADLAASCCPADCEECGPDCKCHDSAEMAKDAPATKEKAATAPATKPEKPGGSIATFASFVRDFSRMTKHLDRLIAGAAPAELGLTDTDVREFAEGLTILSTHLSPTPSSTTKKTPEEGTVTATLTDDQLRKIFEIDEAEDLMTALISRKATSVNLSDYESLSSRVETLTQTAKEREVDEIVTKALRTGKLAPKQAEWAKEYCLSDPAGFSTYLESAVKVVDFREVGTSEDLSTKELTDQELQIAKNLGNDPEKVRALKQRQSA